MSAKPLFIDNLQYSNWSPKVFKEMKEGNLSAVHVTISYHENFRQTIENIIKWNKYIELYPNRLTLAKSADDVKNAYNTDKTAIIFGFQNCSPIEENIGLIEVMGLAILPPRLERELAEVKAFLMGEVETVDPIHQPWADTLKEPAENLSSEQIDLLIQQSVGDIFLKVLKDAGVFKRTEKGQSAFLDFVERLKTV